MARRLFSTGLVGTAPAAGGRLLLLVVVLTGAAERGPLVPWFVALLLPALAAFGGMLVVSLFLRRAG